ncbi:MAG: hypothetical protein HKN82_11810 [Akkermansiaceae bacterium]|nr:hypothetical protein [Akkermansiaceae bacterium]
MKATMIDQAPLRLIVAKSKSFPDGNRDAMASIESKLETLRGRRFYGLAYESEDGIEYYAGILPADDAEEKELVQEGFSVLDIAGGACARIKMADWASKVDQIGPTFGAMAREYGFDATRPQIEFYRSMKELHLLLPVPR